MKSRAHNNQNAGVSLYSSTLDQTTLQGCRQIVRLFFPHVSFVADGKARIEIGIEEHEGGFGAHWSEMGDRVSYVLSGKKLAGIREGNPCSGTERASVPRMAAQKIAAQQAVFGLLQDVTGQTMSWGILTGVRPGRLWQELAAREMTMRERREVLAGTYLVEEAKIDLLQMVADAQQPFLRRGNGDHDVAVYVSIPFCPSRCGYCTFPGYRGCAEKMEAYLAVLFEEIDLLAQDISAHALKVNMVYIGGGTPTALETHQLKKLMAYLAAALPLGNVLEFCCEAGRPDTLSEDKLAVLAEAGVSRLCINPQTLEDETLRRVFRSHSVQDFRRAYAVARHVAEWHINTDMILGLPGEGENHVMKTAEGLMALAPDSITVHYLTLKRGSAMWLNALESGGEPCLDGGRLGGIGDRVCQRLMDEGYHPYYLYRQKRMLGNRENIGYARPGAQCLYNIAMIAECQHVAGLGAGAASKIYWGGQSHRNLYHAKDIDSYGKSVAERAAARSEMWRRRFAGL